MTVLLDSSLVIALVDDEHEHHRAARRWFLELADAFATCPITQGSIVRYVVRRGRSASSSLKTLQSLTRHDRHEFWPDDVEYAEVRLVGVVGHGQVTDAYLAQLARRREGRLATLDRPLADLHSDVAELVPVGPAS